MYLAKGNSIVLASCGDVGDEKYSQHWEKAIETGQSGKTIKDHTGKNVVFIDFVRTPFIVSGTELKYSLPHELGSHAIRKLVEKTTVPVDEIDYVCLGTVIQDVKMTNIAREASLVAGLPAKIPSHTTIQACISANQAMTSAVAMIGMGKANCVLCGGVEVLSNLPVGLSRKLRVLLQSSWPKAKTLAQKLKILSQIQPDMFQLQFTAIAEFLNGKPMGYLAESVVTNFEVSRREQDEYALRSHRLAFEAQEKGFLSDIVPYTDPRSGKVLDKDNGIRKSSMEKLSKLKPGFVRPHGTVTPGNSTLLTDGASVCLLMSEAKAKELGLSPKAYLRNFVYKSHHPIDQPFISPAESIPSLLRESNLTLSDVDVWEMHEAFACQVLATVKAMDSDKYCREHLNMTGKVGMLDMTKLNNWGGSLSIGHPFAATGSRVCAHAVNRLIREDGRLAVASVCGAGGQGVSMLIERHPDAAV